MNEPNSMPKAVVSVETGHMIRQFLGYEALLLDENRIAEWVALLDPSIIYEVPLRIATRLRADELPEGSWRVRDNLAMIRKRLERLGTSENWAEDPPSRTVRTVGSIFIEPGGENGIHRVHSALTLFRQRATDRPFDWIPARRIDLIRESGGACLLVRRTVILAETVLQTPSLSIFF
jgi:3-phenylpropionate/cinnamic acid dioxygenase small subunit